MKKKKVLGAFCLAIACVGAMVYSVHFFSSSSSNELMVQNVEALSGQESGMAYTCYNTITSKDGCQVRYCPTCSFVAGTDAWYSLSKTCKR